MIPTFLSYSVEKRLSARPHHLGSAYGKDNAEWILARFKEWGWNAEIERFDGVAPEDIAAASRWAH